MEKFAMLLGVAIMIFAMLVLISYPLQQVPEAPQSCVFGQSCGQHHTPQPEYLRWAGDYHLSGR